MNKDQVEGKVKIPSTPTTAFVQYTTEELDQLDQPQRSHRKGQEDEQYPTVPPLVYGITPQESLAGMDCYIFNLACNVLSSTQAPKALHAHH